MSVSRPWGIRHGKGDLEEPSRVGESYVPSPGLFVRVDPRNSVEELRWVGEETNE